MKTVSYYRQPANAGKCLFILYNITFLCTLPVVETRFKYYGGLPALTGPLAHHPITIAFPNPYPGM